jgi:hypothetical protein
MYAALCGNKVKGVQVLSGIFSSPTRARDFINDGAGVIVAYDPRTPNRTELIAVIEGAGYGDLAAAKLLIEQLGLDENSDWSTMVNDENLMTVIFGSETTCKMVLNSPSILAYVKDSAVALNALVNSPIAPAETAGNTGALAMLLSTQTGEDAIVGSHAMRSAIYGVTSAFNMLLSVTAFTDMLLSDSNIIQEILPNQTGRNTLFAHTIFDQIKENTTLFDGVIMGNITFRGYMYDNANAMAKVSASERCAALIVFVI